MCAAATLPQRNRSIPRNAFPSQFPFISSTFHNALWEAIPSYNQALPQITHDPASRSIFNSQLDYDRLLRGHKSGGTSEFHAAVARLSDAHVLAHCLAGRCNKIKLLFNQSSFSRMRVIYHNWSATKQRPHPQSVAWTGITPWHWLCLCIASRDENLYTYSMTKWYLW